MSFSFRSDSVSLQPLDHRWRWSIRWRAFRFSFTSPTVSVIWIEKTIRATSLTVLVVLMVCAVLGLRILAFFGISLASFQVAGGALLIISALSMLNAQPALCQTNVDEASYAVSQASVAVVPSGHSHADGAGEHVHHGHFGQPHTKHAANGSAADVCGAGSGIGVCELLHGAAHRPLHGAHRHQCHDSADGFEKASLSVEVISEGRKRCFLPSWADAALVGA